MVFILGLKFYILFCVIVLNYLWSQFQESHQLLMLNLKLETSFAKVIIFWIAPTFQSNCHFNNFSKSSNGIIESIFFPFGEKLGV